MVDVRYKKDHINLFSKEATTNPNKFKISQKQLKTQISTGGSLVFAENNSTTTNIVSRLIQIVDTEQSINSLGEKISIVPNTTSLINSNINSLGSRLYMSTESFIERDSLNDSLIIYNANRTQKIGPVINKINSVTSNLINVESSVNSVISPYSLLDTRISNLLTDKSILEITVDTPSISSIQSYLSNTQYTLFSIIDIINQEFTLLNIESLDRRITQITSSLVLQDKSLNNRLSLSETSLNFSLTNKFSLTDTSFITLENRIKNSTSSINSIDTLLNDVSKITSSISTLPINIFNIDGISSRITYVETNLTLVDTSLETRISNTENSIPEKISSLETKIDTIEFSINNRQSINISNYDSNIVSFTLRQNELSEYVSLIPTINYETTSLISRISTFDSNFNLSSVNSQVSDFIKLMGYKTFDSVNQFGFSTYERNRSLNNMWNVILDNNISLATKAITFVTDGNQSDTFLPTLDSIESYFSSYAGTVDLVALDSRITSLTTKFSDIRLQVDGLIT